LVLQDVLVEVVAEDLELAQQAVLSLSPVVIFG